MHFIKKSKPQYIAVFSNYSYTLPRLAQSTKIQLCKLLWMATQFNLTSLITLRHEGDINPLTYYKTSMFFWIKPKIFYPDCYGPALLHKKNLADKWSLFFKINVRSP